ncbi:MAG: iron-sulfur cluster assembly scaffold protein [Candidatus Peribacteria bacterium]|nr:MAG: iron-sulfur cluster assembly scaffold protein [Candidatus Peribacteria bacterium]
MRQENKALIEEYYRHPQGYHVMDNPTVIGHEGNPVCGDDITVYLRLEDDIIVDYSFSGDISMHTIAASSFWYEFLVDAKIEEVLTWTDTVIQQE